MYVSDWQTADNACGCRRHGNSGSARASMGKASTWPAVINLRNLSRDPGLAGDDGFKGAILREPGTVVSWTTEPMSRTKCAATAYRGRYGATHGHRVRFHPSWKLHEAQKHKSTKAQSTKRAAAIDKFYAMRRSERPEYGLTSLATRSENISREHSRMLQ